MRALIVGYLVALCWIGGTVASAQDAAPPTDAASPTDATEQSAGEDPSDERAAQFVGVRGADAERVPGGALLIAAYAVVWGLLFLFLLRLRGLQRQNAEELTRLSNEIRESGRR